MRKLYCLLAGIVLSLGLSFLPGNSLHAQTNADSCTADFERIAGANNPLLAYFRALPWHNNQKRPEQICWNFGDNHDTCISYSPTATSSYAVSHLYEHPGNYNVCVRIRYQGECTSEKCRMVQIGDSPDSCSADFETVNSTSNALGKYFIAHPWHNHNKKPTRVCWNFGDNHDTCIQYSTTYTGTYAAYHAYEHAGTYNVCVYITYDGGCESHLCKLVTAGTPDSCGADFERIPSATANPLRAYFRALPSHNHDKRPEQICWHFGDGQDTCINYNPSTTNNYVVAHDYAHPGIHNVCIRIRYQGGCVAEKCREQVIGEPDHCEADFERLTAASTIDPLLVGFRALPSHNHNRRPKRICWTFGDGRDTCINYPENYTAGYTVLHHYNHIGAYTVCVKIIYYGECEATKCRQVVVGPLNAFCSVRLFEMAPSAVSLTRTFYILPASSIPNNHPKRICWYFGDGTDSCVMVDSNATTPPYSIVHTYPAPGVYRACVRVLFFNGCEAQDCKDVEIRSHTGICGGYMTDSAVNPHAYVFKGFSIHNPNDNVISYRWTFGDGGIGNGQQVTHSYAAPGEYRVCLLINTEKGCETRICNTVRVAGNVQSVLQIAPNPVINIMHVIFYSTHTEVVNVKVINANGVVVRSYTRNAVIGPNNWDFDEASLPTGVYSLVVQSPNQFASSIFFKQ